MVLVNDTLSTSVGELTLPHPSYASFGVGPAGCVNALALAFKDGACELALTAQLKDGAMTVTSMAGSLSDCPGFTGDATADGLFGDFALIGAVKADTVACDAGLGGQQYCVAGSYDVSLDGTVGTVTFVDQHIMLQGGLCEAQSRGECPATP